MSWMKRVAIFGMSAFACLGCLGAEDGSIAVVFDWQKNRETDSFVPVDTETYGDSFGSYDTDSSGDTGEACDVGDLSGICDNLEGAFQVMNQNNFNFESTLDLTSTAIKGNETLQNIFFDWSTLTQDLYGNPMNPETDVNMVVVTFWNMSKSDLEQAMSSDSTPMPQGSICFETGGTSTSASLLDFTICGGVPVTDPSAVDAVTAAFNGADPAYDPSQFTHLVILKSDTALNFGSDVKMMKAMTLDPLSTDLSVSIDPASATYNPTADLTSLERVPAKINHPSIEIDWSYVTRTGLGNDFIPTQITRVVVAHYDMTVCELEGNLAAMELASSLRYEKELDTVSLSLNLSSLKNAASGASFPGIDDRGGTWIFALYIEEGSINPVPAFMTVLEPCAD